MIKRFRVLIFIFVLVSVFPVCDYNIDTLKVTDCSPAADERGVDEDARIRIGFSRGVNRTDVEDSLAVYGPEGTVNGVFSWSGDSRFVFSPSGKMSARGRYVIEIPRSVRDRDGNTMSSDFISDFYVGRDFVFPVVVSSSPPSSDCAVQGISVDMNIRVEFSKSMDRASVESEFSLVPSASGYFSWAEAVPGLADSSVTWNLTGPMDYGKLYTVTVGAGAKDRSGNSLGSDYMVNFVTGDDFTPPEVTALYWYNRIPQVVWSQTSVNHNVSRDVNMGMDFSEPMDRQSVEEAFSVTPGLPGNFEWLSDSTVVFIPSAPPDPETRYLVTLNTSARDSAGLRLQNQVSAEIVTDADDSLYVKCGSISFSNDGINFIEVSSGKPVPDDWPLDIDMGDDANTALWIRIDFLSRISPCSTVSMDSYSIYGNCMIETFRGDHASPSARIDDINWIGSGTAVIKLEGMTNSPGNVPALYRFTLAGGSRGVKDINGNYMKEDLVFEMKEAVP